MFVCLEIFVDRQKAAVVKICIAMKGNCTEIAFCIRARECHMRNPSEKICFPLWKCYHAMKKCIKMPMFFSFPSFNNGTVCATLLQLFMLIRETENVQKHRRACHFAPGILMSLEMPKFGGGGARRNGAARVVY